MTLAIDASQWGWPQWTYASVFVLNIFFATMLDGQPKSGNHSAGVTLVASVVAGFILVSGGFFA
jgi:hypothetical protein